MTEDELAVYREGFADALLWVLNTFNLDMEDEDELNRVLDGGDCEGSRA